MQQNIDSGVAVLQRAVREFAPVVFANSMGCAPCTRSVTPGHDIRADIDSCRIPGQARNDECDVNKVSDR